MPYAPKVYRPPGSRTRKQINQEYERHRRHRDPGRTTRYAGAWRRVRKVELARAPFCEICGPLFGRTVLATTVNHIVPWRHDESQFLVGPFECLCKSCHARITRCEDFGGCPFYLERDKDGRPIDSDHWFYKQRIAIYGPRQTGGRVETL